LSQVDRSAAGSPEFRPQHLACMQRTASLISHLIEHKVLSSIVGWKCP
jgi:hypothetical protein